MSKKKNDNCSKNEQINELAIETSKDKVKRIINDLSTDVYSVTVLCRKHEISVSQFYKEINKDRELEQALSLARINQAWIYADQIIDIADTCPPEKELLNKARIAIDARKFLLAQLRPQKHIDNLLAALEASRNNDDSRLEKVINEAKGDANALSKIYEQLIKQPAALKGSVNV